MRDGPGTVRNLASFDLKSGRPLWWWKLVAISLFEEINEEEVRTMKGPSHCQCLRLCGQGASPVAYVEQATSLSQWLNQLALPEMLVQCNEGAKQCLSIAAACSKPQLWIAIEQWVTWDYVGCSTCRTGLQVLKSSSDRSSSEPKAWCLGPKNQEQRHALYLLKLFDDWGMTIWKSHFADCQSPDTSESQPLSSHASQQGIVCFDKASQHRWGRNLLNQRIGRLLLPWFLFGRNTFFLHMTQYMYKDIYIICIYIICIYIYVYIYIYIHT